jgi:CYTH domain-containing protein
MEPVFERERRFLVGDQGVLAGIQGDVIVQGYLFSKDGYVVRVRRIHHRGREAGEKDLAMFALKGPRYRNAREEYEIEIPSATASQLMQRAPYTVSKTRYELIEADGTWDVDVFHGDNEGLVIAEYEARDPSQLEVPSWCGEEITDDLRYSNENLAETPYRCWSSAEE